DRVDVRTRVVGRMWVAKHRSGLARRHAQCAARVGRCRAEVGFVLRASGNDGEDAECSITRAGLEEQKSQRAAQTVDADIARANAEQECFLEYGAGVEFVTVGERCAAEPAQRNGTGPGS